MRISDWSSDVCSSDLADITLDGLLAVYSIPRISQIQLIWRATLARPEFSAGPESPEVRLFGWDEIPWPELAFPSVPWALWQYDAVKDPPVFPTFTNPPGEHGHS